MERQLAFESTRLQALGDMLDSVSSVDQVDRQEALAFVGVGQLAVGVLMCNNADRLEQFGDGVDGRRVSVNAALGVGHVLARLPTGPLASVQQNTITHVGNEKGGIALDALNSAIDVIGSIQRGVVFGGVQVKLNQPRRRISVG